MNQDRNNSIAAAAHAILEGCLQRNAAQGARFEARRVATMEARRRRRVKYEEDRKTWKEFITVEWISDWEDSGDEGQVG